MSGRRRVLVTGGAGNVAGWLARTAPGDIELHVTEHRTPVHDDVRAVATLHPVDLRRWESTLHLLVDVRPDVVVHAAYSQSDRAAIVDASLHMAGAAQQVGAAVLHLSTDVVFSGDAPPYAEHDEPDPVSDYGRWKAEAEQRVLGVVPDACITRTSLVVSLDPLDVSSGSFVDALSCGREVTLFRDEMRQPIRAEDLAAELWALVARDRSERAGIWHLPGPEHLSRWELGERLAARMGLDPAAIVAAFASEVAPERPRDTRLTSTRREKLGVRLRSVDA